MQRALISLLFSTLPLATLGCLIPLTAEAQITPDGTTSTTVNQNGNDFTIDQGDRVGDNLFHSFDEFSVPTLGSAEFNNASDIANIFSRVTGSNISDIDGLLSANGAANLFLINPNGIIFGPNARLNLGGSFFASTADSLLFEGNTEFSASNPQAPPLLKISIPIGINFRDNPGDIVNNSVPDENGSLSVSSGATFALLGGDVNFTGGVINSRGSNVLIGGLSESGTISLDDNFNPSFPDDVARADVSLTNGALVDVSGEGGGNIAINARNLEILGRIEAQKATFAITGLAGSQSGDIVLNATGAIRLDSSTVDGNSEAGAVGDGSDIEISGQSISLTDTLLTASNAGQGNAGRISIKANDDVSISNNSSC